MAGTKEDEFRKYIATLPKVFNPEFNQVIRALFLAIAEADAELCNQTQNAKDQLFVRTATGKNLDQLANSLGVSRPATLGLRDDEFQELVPNLSLKPKQIKKAFYDTADVFWGPLFSRANVTTINAAPFNLSAGDEISIKVDNGETQTIVIFADDIATPGAATADEVISILSRVEGITPTILTDSLTGDQTINIRTNTPGQVGTLEIVSSSGISASKLNLPVGLVDILDLSQRVVVYNLNPNELIIELPAIVPSLRRTLKGSHHIHTDGTLESPEPPNNGIWQGSFLFNPDGSGGNFTITSQKATLTQPISKGDVLTSIVVDDNSNFEVSTGDLIFGFGTENEEVPIGFRGIPNSSTILVDPSYSFTQDHPIGTVVNVISQKQAYTPTRNGDDLAIYLTSPSGAREIVQDIIETLKAAGIIISFVILAPEYRYLCDNPYLSDDDAPSI